MKHMFRIFISFLFLGICLSSISVFAGDENIKTRMLERRSDIRELKTKGIIGENSKGYLEFRGSNREEEDVVEAENKDRKTIYSAIAKQQGTTAELVGKRRAIQLGKKADPGDWLRDESGKWVRKK